MQVWGMNWIRAYHTKQWTMGGTARGGKESGGTALQARVLYQASGCPALKRAPIATKRRRQKNKHAARTVQTSSTAAPEPWVLTQATKRYTLLTEGQNVQPAGENAGLRRSLRHQPVHELAVWKSGHLEVAACRGKLTGDHGGESWCELHTCGSFTLGLEAVARGWGCQTMPN